MIGQVASGRQRLGLLSSLVRKKAIRKMELQLKHKFLIDWRN